MVMNQWSRAQGCDTNACVEVQWQKSQLSSTNGSCVEVGFHAASSCDNTTCVEVGFHAASSCDNDSCVEVRTCDCDEVLVRDSKDPGGPVLSYTRDEWLAFLDGAKKGEFDL